MGQDWQKSIHEVMKTPAIDQNLQKTPIPDLETWPDLPAVSVIAAAWNEDQYIEEFLGSFSRLDYPNKELILVAGGSDDTLQLARGFSSSQIIVLEQYEGEGKFQAIRRGLKHSTADLIFLTDADSLLNSESFARTVYPVATGEESVTTGLTRPLKNQLENSFIRAQYAHLTWRMRRITSCYVPFLIGANCVIQRELVNECWLTAPELAVGEDYYLALSLRESGHAIRYVYESTIETRFPSSFKEYVAQKSRWHRSHLLLNYTFGKPHWMINVMIAFCCQLLLAMPILLYWSGFIGVFLLFLSWGVFFFPYILASYLAKKLSLCPPVPLLSLIQLMLADCSARAICLPQLILKRWRLRW